jgi:hypothetical protein
MPNGVRPWASTAGPYNCARRVTGVLPWTGDLGIGSWVLGAGFWWFSLTPSPQPLAPSPAPGT